MLVLKKFLKSYWQYLVLVLLVVITYIGSLNNAFVSDDIPTFVKNTTVQTRDGLTFLEKINVQKLIYYVSYRLFELNPTPLHILSLFLHALNAALFYKFIKVFFREKIAFASALLFAVHPINSEAVLWVSALNYLIYFAFNIALSLFYVKAKTMKSIVVLLVVYFLAIVFTFNIWMLLTPFVIFFVELLNGGKSLKSITIRVGPFFLVSFATFFLLYRTTFVVRSEYINEVNENLHARLLKYTIPYSIGSTAKFLIYPQGLTLYHEGEFALPNVVKTSRYLFFTILILELYLLLKQRKYFYVSAMIFVSILPTVSPIRMSNFFAERYVYFGSAFFCVLLVSLLEFLSKKAKSTELFVMAIFVLILFYASVTVIRSAEWKDPITFWESTVRESKNSAGAYNNLGIEYVRAGRFEDALVQFQNSVKINPNVPDAQYNLGKILLVGGRYDLAEPYLLNALKLSPNEPKIIQAVNDLNAKKQGL